MKVFLNKVDKKQILLFLLLFVTSLLYISRGVMRYVVYSVASLTVFLYKKKCKSKYYLITLHVFIYIVIGFLIALVKDSICGESFKQSLIYLCCGYTAVNYFFLYGEKNTVRLVDIQFYSMCIAYMLLYFAFNKDGHIYWESHIFGYIFGIYIIVYFCQKRYLHVFVATIFTLLEHKRIVNLAVIIVTLLLLFFSLIKNEKLRRNIYVMLNYAFVLCSFLWIYICYSDFLSETLQLTEKFTSSRLIIWNSVRNYYSFEVGYIGAGIGWIRDWMSSHVICNTDILHNDFLAAYIELGFIGYLLWILSYIVMFRTIEKNTNKKTLYILFFMYIYLFINCLTDNNYIYISFMLPFNIISLSILYGSDSNKFSKILD